MLPAYAGLTYRGVDFEDKQSKKGKVVCYKTFFSSSKDPKKATSFGIRTYYTIKSLTGPQISNFSYFQTQAQVLFMPYSYFYVTELSKTQYGIAVTLEQIPIPRSINSNLLMWVDDHPTEGSKILQDLQLSYPKLTKQSMQLTSNEHSKAWLRKFGHCAKLRPKISLITDLRRIQVLDAGLATIRMIRKSLGNTVNIYIYTLKLLPALKWIQINNEQLSEKLAIGNQSKEVMKFITEKVFQKEELKPLDQTCQLI